MNLSSIARKNVKGNMYKYIMYSLSNAFAITIFFIFYNYSNHPLLQTDIGGNKKIAIDQVMGLNRIIIVLFSLIFVKYSTKVFVNSRGREFGLLSLYGMTKKQLKKYVLVENMLLSIISIIIGLTTGILFTKLFFMILGSFVGVNFNFYISIKALLGTSIIFMLLFFLMNLYSVSKIKDEEIINQIKRDRKIDRLPSYFKLKGILGVILLFIGYGLSIFTPPRVIILLLMPVTITVILGTYLIFTEFSIFLVNKILKNNKILYKKNNFISYSHIAYKLKDTVKIMFLVSILTAITLTAMGTIYSIYTETPRLLGVDTIHDMTVLIEEENQMKNIKNIEKDLIKNNIKLDNRLEIEGLLYKDNEDKYLIISNSIYNKTSELLKGPKLNIKNDEYYFNLPFSYKKNMTMGENIERSGEKRDIKFLDKNYKYSGGVLGSPLSIYNLGYKGIYIVNDKEYEILKEDMKSIKYFGYSFDDTKKALEINKKYLALKSENLNIESKIVKLDENKNENGSVLFIGFFTVSLFFIASGSILYFKLFNSIEKDKLEYNIIRKVGATDKEINKMATKEIGLLFFIPFIFGTIHSLFAMSMLSNLIMNSVLTNGMIVSIGYLIFQIIYFLILRKVYINKLKYN